MIGCAAEPAAARGSSPMCAPCNGASAHRRDWAASTAATAAPDRPTSPGEPCRRQIPDGGGWAARPQPDPARGGCQQAAPGGIHTNETGFTAAGSFYALAGIACAPLLPDFLTATDPALPAPDQRQSRTLHRTLNEEWGPRAGRVGNAASSCTTTMNTIPRSPQMGHPDGHLTRLSGDNVLGCTSRRGIGPEDLTERSPRTDNLNPSQKLERSGTIIPAARPQPLQNRSSRRDLTKERT